MFLQRWFTRSQFVLRLLRLCLFCILFCSSQTQNIWHLMPLTPAATHLHHSGHIVFLSPNTKPLLLLAMWHLYSTIQCTAGCLIFSAIFCWRFIKWASRWGLLKRVYKKCQIWLSSIVLGCCGSSINYKTNCIVHCVLCLVFYLSVKSSLPFPPGSYSLISIIDVCTFLFLASASKQNCLCSVFVADTKLQMLPRHPSIRATQLSLSVWWLLHYLLLCLNLWYFST